MIHVPAQDELYERVEESFYRYFPDAPRPLTTSASDAVWRTRWFSTRDQILQEEVHRVYRGVYPDAPADTYPGDSDPGDGGHDTHQQAWNDIRDSIMNNAPRPVLAADRDEVDTSDLRLHLDEALRACLSQLPADLRPVVEGYAEATVTEAVGRIKAGTLVAGGDHHDIYYPERVSSQDPQRTVWAASRILIEDGRLTGNMGIYITDGR
jgi:hypothetical protein